MTRTAVVTTFNEASYRGFGRRMLDTFDSYWPREVQLLAYSEAFKPGHASDRIVFRDLLEASPDLVAFRERHRHNPQAHGQTSRRMRLRIEWRKPKIRILRVCDEDAFLWQAVRFSHKTFAIFHAAAHCEADRLFWLDSDVITRTQLPASFIERMIPGNAMLGYIGRRKFSDCCIIGFNLRHPQLQAFLAAFRELYVTDRLFKYPQYHDSYLFDVLRRKFERRGAHSHDMADGVGHTHGHVFEHCDLGHYLDHLKGARKAAESPPPALKDLAQVSG